MLSSSYIQFILLFTDQKKKKKDTVVLLVFEAIMDCCYLT